MQLQIKKQLWFIQCLMAISLLWSRIRRICSASLDYDLYRTCSDLPLDRFVRCLCDGDYTALQREGRAPKELLTAAWEKIYMEYIELDGSTQTVYLNQVRKDIMLLGSKIDKVLTIVRALDILYDKRLVAELKDIGLPFKYNYVDQARFRKDLISTIHYLAPWKLEYTQLEKELNSMVSENESGTRVERSYFDKILARLSKYYQYQVRAKDISVTEFVTQLKEYTNHLEQLNRHGKQR